MYALVVPMSIMLAIGNRSAWERLAMVVTRRIAHYPEAQQERFLWSVYVAAGIWWLAGPFAADWLVSAVLRFVS